jgi:hypothetical protein
VLFHFFPEPQHGPGKVICDQHRQGLADAGAEHYDQLLVLQPFNMEWDNASLDAGQLLDELQIPLVHGSGFVHNLCLGSQLAQPATPAGPLRRIGIGGTSLLPCQSGRPATCPFTFTGYCIALSVKFSAIGCLTLD